MGEEKRRIKPLGQSTRVDLQTNALAIRMPCSIVRSDVVCCM